MSRKFSRRLGSQADGALPLGGPGSGHFGHAGRPGYQGESLASGTKAGVAKEAEEATAKKAVDDAAAGSKAEIARLARDLRAGAVKVEPEVTKTLVETVTGLGGEMAGLQHRLKSHSSIESKINRDMSEQVGVAPADVAAGINDLIRYTALIKPETFLESVKKIQADLEAKGWMPFDHKYKNFFFPGNSYQGYNTVMVNPDGVRMELQYHTPETITIKERAHDLYVKARELPSGDELREKLNDQMASLWDNYIRPKDWEKLPGRLVTN